MHIVSGASTCATGISQIRNKPAKTIENLIAYPQTTERPIESPMGPKWDIAHRAY